MSFNPIQEKSVISNITFKETDHKPIKKDPLDKYLMALLQDPLDKYLLLKKKVTVK